MNDNPPQWRAIQPHPPGMVEPRFDVLSVQSKPEDGR